MKIKYVKTEHLKVQSIKSQSIKVPVNKTKYIKPLPKLKIF